MTRPKKKSPARAAAPAPLAWRDAASARFVKRGLWWWDENGGDYCRLPLRAEGVVNPNVWRLARHTAGGRIAFRSNSSSLSVRVTNISAEVMSHMPGSGSGGLQVYAKEVGGNDLRPLTAAVPDPESPSYERALVANLPKRDIMIHFYSKMRRQGDLGLHFIDSFALLPPGLEAAFCDGGHPSDHGFQVMAERLVPTLRHILRT